MHWHSNVRYEIQMAFWFLDCDVWVRGSINMWKCNTEWNRCYFSSIPLEEFQSLNFLPLILWVLFPRRALLTTLPLPLCPLPPPLLLPLSITNVLLLSLREQRIVWGSGIDWAAIRASSRKTSHIISAVYSFTNSTFKWHNKSTVSMWGHGSDKTLFIWVFNILTPTRLLIWYKQRQWSSALNCCILLSYH